MSILLATVIWGSSFFIMKDTLESVDILRLLAIRFSIAAVLLALLFISKLRLLDWGYIRDGSFFGALLFAAYVIQTYGLRFTTPGKNAFLTAVYCLIVPLFGWIFTKRAPTRDSALAAFLCICGIALVSLSGGEMSSMGKGDAMSLLGGFFFAAHIYAVSRLLRGRDVILITTVQFASAAVLAWLFGAFFADSGAVILSGGALVSLLYLGIFATAATLLLQNMGQKYLPAPTTALLLSLEAVFGVLFSVVFFGERPTLRLLIGFALIFGAIFVSEGKRKEV
ncbi:MAG: DMT family transporter [Clostridia bacterium]|nr:DMT family transporter [Clostridia bacterium]